MDYSLYLHAWQRINPQVARYKAEEYVKQLVGRLTLPWEGHFLDDSAENTYRTPSITVEQYVEAYQQLRFLYERLDCTPSITLSRPPKVSVGMYQEELEELRQRYRNLLTKWLP